MVAASQPDLADGEDEMVDQEIIKLQRGLQQQVIYYLLMIIIIIFIFLDFR